ncbi:MAG: hypothetical protein ACOC5L_02165 [Halobacteriota archaeon]
MEKEERCKQMLRKKKETYKELEEVSQMKMKQASQILQQPEIQDSMRGGSSLGSILYLVSSLTENITTLGYIFSIEFIEIYCILEDLIEFVSPEKIDEITKRLEEHDKDPFVRQIRSKLEEIDNISKKHNNFEVMYG